MPNARRLKYGIRSSVLTAEKLLATMMATAKTKQHVRHLNKICHLTYKVDNDLLDINCEGTDHVNDEELQDFGNSIIDIGRRSSAFYKDLFDKEVSIFNANTNLLYARQRAHEGKEFRRKYAVGEILPSSMGTTHKPPQTLAYTLGRSRILTNIRGRFRINHMKVQLLWRLSTQP